MLKEKYRQIECHNLVFKLYEFHLHSVILRDGPKRSAGVIFRVRQTGHSSTSFSAEPHIERKWLRNQLNPIRKSETRCKRLITMILTSNYNTKDKNFVLIFCHLKLVRFFNVIRQKRSSEWARVFLLLTGHDWKTQGSNKFKSKSLAKIMQAPYNDMYGYYSLLKQFTILSSVDETLYYVRKAGCTDTSFWDRNDLLETIVWLSEAFKNESTIAQLIVKFFIIDVYFIRSKNIGKQE